MKKILSIVLSLIMVMTMLPTFAINAFAKEKLETPTLTINGAVYSYSEVEHATDYYIVFYDESDNYVTNSSSSNPNYDWNLSFSSFTKGEKYKATIYCGDSTGTYEESDKAVVNFTYDPYAFGYGNEKKTVTYSFDKATKTLTFTPVGTTDLVVRGFNYMASQFYKTSDIDHVVFENGIVYISGSSYPFYQSHIKDVTIPQSITSISSDFIRELDVTDGWIVDKDNINYTVIDGSLYSKNGKSLYHYVQKGTDCVIDESVNYIGTHAFGPHINLNSLTLNGLNLETKTYAFDGMHCKHFTVNEGVKSIGDYSSINDWEDETFNIPSTLTQIGSQSILEHDSAIKNISVADGNTAFSTKDGVLYNADGSTLLAYPRSRDEAIFAVPDGTTSIEFKAFSGVKNLVTLDCPASVKTFKYSFINSCSKLETINIRALDATFDKDSFKMYSKMVYVYPNSQTATNIARIYDNAKIDNLPLCTEHDFDVTEVAPTCYAKGHDDYTCKVCNYSEIRNESEFTDHEIVVTYSPDKTQEYHKCKNYGFSATETEDLPESAHDYANNTHEEYEISYPEASIITISFDSNFSLETNYDYLTFTDSKGNELERFTGEQLAGKTLTFDTNYVKMTLTSDGSGVKYGFKVTQITAKKIGCDYAETVAHTHSFTDYIADGTKTCTTDGLKIATCECGETDSIVDAKTGHTWNVGEVTTPATCIADGVRTYTCENCTDTYTEVIKATEHNYTVEKSAKVDATCTTDGTTAVMQCANCDATIGGETIQATGHKYTTTTTKATTSVDGKKATKCSVCGNVKSTTTIKKVSTVKLSATNYTYDGKVKSPTLTVKDSAGKALVKGTDYTVTTPTGRKNVGKYTYKITFKGNYSGTKSLSFTVVPKSTTISSLTAASKGFTVKWKKQATQTTGYQIQIATDSGFTKGVKNYTVTSNSTVSKKITGLTGGKKYYVRIRTYKTVSGTKYYSSWSGSKSVTTKK